MKKVFATILVVLLVGFGVGSAQATNGDYLIGIGPISRSMGGVGIAAPQDAISAVFANPAAMCFGPYCPESEINFAGTLFAPEVKAKVTNAKGTIEADGDDKVYPIPAFGLSVPITQAPPFWRFGLSAYGVSGLGVDYRDTAIENNSFYNFGPMGQFPLVAGSYTELSIMKFAPSIAVQPFDKWSFGLAFHIDYASLDLGDGSSNNYGYGVQVGAIYKPTEKLSFGLNYVSPQNVDFDNVSDFDGDGSKDTLKLEMPQTVGLGAAYQLTSKLLVEADVKWVNWSSANGYEDFDWDDQWVFAIGGQYAVTTKLKLRAGYNYASNPVNEHNGFNGMQMTSVQGKSMPAYYYETFRIIGFPAIAEHHLSFGIGYAFTPRFEVNFGYMHAFSNSISETGTDITGRPVELKSDLSEDSLDFGLTWRF